MSSLQWRLKDGAYSAAFYVINFNKTVGILLEKKAFSNISWPLLETTDYVHGIQKLNYNIFTSNVISGW